MYNFSNVPHYDLEVSAWLMGSVNSGEWGDDLPPHPSPSDGHGKPAPDRLGGRQEWRVQMGLRIGPELDLGYRSMVAGRTRGGGGWRKVWPGLRSGIYDGGIRWTTASLVKCLYGGRRWIIWLLLHALRVTNKCALRETTWNITNFGTVLQLTFVKEQPRPI